MSHRYNLRTIVAVCTILAAFFLSLSLAQAATVTFSSSGNWTAPTGVTSITVEAWGGGGAGGGATANASNGGGGAGGQYAMKVLTVTPGSIYAVVVGSGGTGSTGNGTAGGDSTFATTSVVAKGGAAGVGGNTAAKAGAAGTGSVTGGVGATVYAGGSGSAGVVKSNACNSGGSGGGGAGSTGAGGNASGNTAGSGTSNGGGNGGAGSNSSSNGNPGNSAGGGGAGACAESSTTQSGGAGAAGQVVITYSAPFLCNPPANAPSGLSLTCACDNFNRATLNPSTIFGANWIASTSDSTGILPSIVNNGYLRLTNNTGNNAKAVTVPAIFPAAGNYISVEFQQFAYNGSGADGIAMTLSDYSVPAVPGAYGGSLGYAQETGIHDGFAGGWLGVGLDEYGNYQNTNEGRLGGPGFTVESVGARGSGSGQTGYRWLGGTGTLSPKIDNNTSTIPSLGYYYQVIVDARSEPTSTTIAVNRDTTGSGTSYSPLISIPNVYSAATAQGFTQSPVPTNWQISFTGSTGGSTNIHEISSLRICASSIFPTSGGTASGFSAIDEAYGIPPGVGVQNYLTGHIYTKLVGSSFKLNVAALSNSQIVTTYAASSAKTVTVKLVDNSDSLNDSTKDCTLSCTSTCTSKSAVTGGTQTLTFAAGASDKGQKQSSSFTINSAYQKLVAIISDGTTNACSIDAFSVRPLSVTSVTSSNATNTSTSGTPIFKAGSDNFSLTATTSGVASNASGYTGNLKINGATIQTVSPATVVGAVAGTVFPAATSATPSSTTTGNFTYSEVGAFQLAGYNPASDTTSPRSVFDGVATSTECTALALTSAQCDVLRIATWTGVDSISTKGDCNLDSYSNTKDANGKYGCSFGLVSTTAVIGRFVPDHLTLTSAKTTQRSDITSAYVQTSETTGTIIAGVNVLSVASTSNFAIGDAVVIFGAGTGGGDLLTTVTAIGSGLLTLNTSAAISVTNAPVFKRLGFTYMDEPLLLVLSLEARNATGAKTQNYATSTGLAKLDNSNLTGTSTNAWSLSGVVNNLYGVVGCRALFSSISPYNTSYSSGCGSLPASAPSTPYTASAARISPSSIGTVIWVAGATSLTTNMTLKRANGPDGAFNFTNGTFAIGILPKDGDGITLLSANDGADLLGAAKNLDIDTTAGADTVAVGVADMRFGRLRLINTYNSELLDTRVEVRAEYWDSGRWITNTLDSSTPLSNGNIFISNINGSFGTPSIKSITPFSAGSGGVGYIVFNKTSLPGSFDIALDLNASGSDTSCNATHGGTAANMSWLKGYWSTSCGSTAGWAQDPNARIKLGSPKAPYIYLRERY